MQIGGTLIASALHSSGQYDTLTLKGDWTAGTHKVEVNFLNDGWGGSSSTDRNLYVENAIYNGKSVDASSRFVAWVNGVGALSPTRIQDHAVRTYSGRSRSSIRFSVAAAIATSVA